MAKARFHPACCIIFLLLLLCNLAVASPSSNSGQGPRRDLLVISTKKRNQPGPNCAEIASRLDCARTSGCRWCRSDAVDDMCFSSAQAWRLPSQVFSCD